MIEPASRLRRSTLAIAAACLLVPATAHAGPPYVTDDPEPVEYLHWEIYLATQHEFTPDGATGTAPHLEVNFGAAPNLQLHLIAPLAYARPRGGPAAYGPGDVELGAKLRFVEEGKWLPMVGTFPLVELPAGSELRGLGTGHPRVFFPSGSRRASGRGRPTAAEGTGSIRARGTKTTGRSAGRLSGDCRSS